MNRKFALGVLFVSAIFISAAFNFFVSAEKAGNDKVRALSPQGATVVINEVYGGGGNTGATYNADFIELYNTGTTAFSLSGYSLQYASASTNSFNQVIALPDVSIPAGGYYLVQTTAAGTVGASLPTPDFTANPSVNLSATNGNVIFTNTITALGATCPASSSTTDKIGFGTGICFETAAAPVGSNTTSDQRVPAGSDTDNNSVDFQALAPTPQGSGTSGTPTPTPTSTPTPTPTPVPAATPGIVINEIYGGGGNSGAAYTYDFVELYNNSSANVNISGYSLQYGSAAGTTFSSCTLVSSDLVIEPGTYFLVQFASSNGAIGAQIPTPNAVCTQNFSATAGKIALVNGTTALTGSCPTDATIVDFVGYGTTATCSETAPAPAPSATLSIQRTPVGTDTNNNSLDFTAQTPSPTRAATGLPPGIGRNVDFDGDNRSDYVVTRTVNNLKYWFVNNLTNSFTSTQWGVSTDKETPADFDGDGKTDYAVWRGNDTDPNRSYFYILQSNGNIFRAEQFGRVSDDPRVVADYDGDKKADVAVYRTAAGQNYLFYRGSLTGGNGFTSIPFGAGDSSRPNVGDYDGDGKADVCVQYDSGGGSGVFAVVNSSTGTIDYTPWGSTTDRLVPGDYDGDGKSDFAVVRDVGGQLTWYILYRAGGGTGGGGIGFGVTGDVIVPGDYDGENKQDIAVWRTGSQGYFFVRRSSDSTLQSFPWGTTGDYPAANWYVH